MQTHKKTLLREVFRHTERCLRQTADHINKVTAAAPYKKLQFQSISARYHQPRNLAVYVTATGANGTKNTEKIDLAFQGDK